jgi:hypothetical protein
MIMGRLGRYLPALTHDHEIRSLLRSRRAEARGPCNYFAEAAGAPELAALLTGSPAFGLAEALTGPGTLVAPWQVQVALNIPPFPHRPGMHHIDGFPPGPDGRPGTFTMLAGVRRPRLGPHGPGIRPPADSLELPGGDLHRRSRGRAARRSSR